jgi:hypothetical protein
VSASHVSALRTTESQSVLTGSAAAGTDTPDTPDRYSCGADIDPVPVCQLRHGPTSRFQKD